MDGLDRARLFLVFREALDFKWVYGMLSVPGCFCVLSVLRSRFAVHDTVFCVLVCVLYLYVSCPVTCYSRAVYRHTLPPG